MGTLPFNDRRVTRSLEHKRYSTNPTAPACLNLGLILGVVFADFVGNAPACHHSRRRVVGWGMSRDIGFENESQHEF